MSRSTFTTAVTTLDDELDGALYTAKALRLILFDLEGEGLSADARRAAAELAHTVEWRLKSARLELDHIERQRRADTLPVKAGRA